VLREVVESSSLRSIGYDRATSTLEVEFRAGRVYRYVAVPVEVWRGLRQAASKGEFFQNYVRDRFEATRVA